MKDPAERLLSLPVPEDLVEAFADAVAERVVARLAAREPTSSPWLTTQEAIAYSRLPEGTFRKRMADGQIPSHGGRARVFHVAELDRALGYDRPPVTGARLRRADAA